MKSMLTLAGLILLISCKKDEDRPNTPPLANAGEDVIVELPNNSTFLNGSRSRDPENNITSYEWTKVSGPQSFNILNANRVYPKLEDLEEGNYQIELKVTDKAGLFSRDTVNVNVVLNGTTFTNLKWENDGTNQMLYMQSPEIPSVFQGRTIRKVSLWDNDWGGWVELQKDGTTTDTFYYKIESNSVVAYIYYVNFDPNLADILSTELKIDFD
jgi:hypothetical protein